MSHSDKVKFNEGSQCISTKGCSVNRHAVIVGGSGFIGEYAVSAFLLEGWRVTVVDPSPFNNWLHQNRSQFKVLNIDASDIGYIRDYAEDADVIVNLAMHYPEPPHPFAIANTGSTQNSNCKCCHTAYKEPKESSRETNFRNVFEASKALLSAAHHYNPSVRHILLSSRSVYGPPHCIPVDEKHPTRPITEYGKQKLLIEQLYACFSNEYGSDVCILRATDAYGPRKLKAASNLGTIGRMICEAIYHNKITIWNKTLIRDFIYAEDIGRAIAYLASSSHDNIEVINIGSGEGVKLESVCSAIREHLNCNIEIVEDMDDKGRLLSFSFVADVAKIMSMAEGKFNPVDIDLGISLTVSDYLRQLSPFHRREGDRT